MTVKQHFIRFVIGLIALQLLACDQVVEFKSREFGFSVSLPEDWERHDELLDVPGPFTTVVIVAHPYEDEDDPLQESIAIIAKHKVVGEETRDICQQQMNWQATIFSDYIVEDQGSDDVNGHPSSWYLCSFNSFKSLTRVKNKFTLVDAGEVLVGVSVMTTSADWEAYEPLFEDVIGSLQFFQPSHSRSLESPI